MYNKQKLVFIKDAKPFATDKDDEHYVGVVIKAEFETKDVQDILDFGFGEYVEFARYLVTTRELPIDGDYGLRVQKKSDVMIEFPGCEGRIPCEVEKVVMLGERSVDSKYRLMVQIKCYDVNEDDMGVICSQLKCGVIIKLLLQQSELPIPTQQKEVKEQPKQGVKVESSSLAKEYETEEEKKPTPEEVTGRVTDPDAFPFFDEVDPMEEYNRDPDTFTKDHREDL